MSRYPRAVTASPASFSYWDSSVTPSYSGRQSKACEKPCYCCNHHATPSSLYIRELVSECSRDYPRPLACARCGIGSKPWMDPWLESPGWQVRRRTYCDNFSPS
ncbi:Hypothetical predicted protein [Pelobates cultripes]|uniref:Uncharacterized protein n=1 Tax=Pelobates cultripes TaxID=61616 RepID=A0AAD1WDI4_PELCU|nr:Hypothetical predicted protein [Pelobates cultripes]